MTMIIRGTFICYGVNRLHCFLSFSLNGSHYGPLYIKNIGEEHQKHLMDGGGGGSKTLEVGWGGSDGSYWSSDSQWWPQ